jgi:NADH dehydrogenase
MHSASTTSNPRVVIIGGGFAGLYAAQTLKRAPVEVTLIDRRNFHLFQPLLYQVATGGLSPANISAPLRAILKDQPNATVLMGEVTTVNPNLKHVGLKEGLILPYDYLIVATGVTHNYFGNDQWEVYAPGLKTVEDATEIRRRILSGFEMAELEPDPMKRTELLRFAVVGGGPTGVELAGALGEIAHQTLKDNFRRFEPDTAEILLIEAGERILEQYLPTLSEKAQRSLEKLGVKVLTRARVTEVKDTGIAFLYDDQPRFISTRCVLWAAGVKASPLGKIIAEQTGAALDRTGRVIVQSDLTVPGYESLYVIGDLAFVTEANKPVPGVAPAAIQAGKYAALQIQAKVEGRPKTQSPFHYRDKGRMATIGRSLAVAEIGPWAISGFVAWLIWLFIHVLYLVEFTNRLLVLIQWGWNYFTRNRSARLITGERGPLKA